MRGADIQKVPSLDSCKLLGCNLIICSNPSGVFSTVTHSVVQVVQVVREPLLDRSSLRHVVAPPPNRSEPLRTTHVIARPRARLPYRPTAQPLCATSSLPLNRSSLRHVIAAAQPLKSTAQPLNRSSHLSLLLFHVTLTFSCHSYFLMSLLLFHVTLTEVVLTSIRQIRQFLRDIHTYTYIHTTFIHAQSWSILHSSGPPE